MDRLGHVMRIDRQRTAKAQGMNLEAGQVTFQPNEFEVEIPTMLKNLFYANGMLQTASAQVCSPVCTCDYEIRNNKVTFRRSGPYFGETAAMGYLIVGW
jgi:hypothetical protein